LNRKRAIIGARSSWLYTICALAASCVLREEFLMKTTIVTKFFIGSLLLVGVAACDYEWKDNQSKNKAEVSAGVRSDEKGPEAPPAVDKVVSNERPVLAPGKQVLGDAVMPKGLTQINLAELAEKGVLKVSSNDPSAESNLNLVIDEIETTLVRSNQINPLVFTLDFSEPHTIKAVKVLSSYSDYGWAIKVDEGERFVVPSIIENQWSTIVWPQGLKGKKVMIEVLRITRDNYVHVNEIGLFE